MHRYAARQRQLRDAATRPEAALAESEGDKFPGRTIVVDLADVNGSTQAFEGKHWLEQCLNEGATLGWSIEWQPDRTPQSNNDVAIMVFGDADVALLLRTHRTKFWLPDVVRRVLESLVVRKVFLCSGGVPKQKMKDTFNLEVKGLVDLLQVACRKGIIEQELRELGGRCQIRIRRDRRSARSQWTSQHLTEGQLQYAAEGAYYHSLIL